ncbi:ADP-ribosylglycohydrolase family protein, partial [Streptomyces sp. NPDC005534]|uniref:ADP-ribosylglycohydrolase family protein n=1 Tax=Streptomyces sp. NPDC005534 TaxID=3155714 RepID=UPI003453A608
MNELGNLSWEAEARYRARVRGCLLGGAVGDALGYPVEFDALAGIRAAHGPRGVRGPVAVGAGAGGRVREDTPKYLWA